MPSTWTEIFYVVLASIISFMLSLHLVRWWIRKAHEIGLTGKDMNKPEEIQVPESGGIWVGVAASFGLLVFIALQIYLSKYKEYNLELMALALMLFMSSFLGFLDDILGWKKGLKPWSKIIYMAPLALPIVVIKAGYSIITLPIIGSVNLGLLYPLVLVPIGILGAANAFNMLAGYNGLEAGQGILLMLFTLIYSWIKDLHPSLEASAIMLAAILGFMIYNWYPAKVFPGNSFTHGLGAYYAAIVIMGNFEKFGIMLFTLYFIELALFLRGLKDGVYKENFGKVQPDGTIMPPYEKAYSLTHLAIKVLIRIRGYAQERDVTLLILSLQTIIGLLSLFLIRYV